MSLFRFPRSVIVLRLCGVVALLIGSGTKTVLSVSNMISRSKRTERRFR